MYIFKTILSFITVLILFISSTPPPMQYIQQIQTCTTLPGVTVWDDKTEYCNVGTCEGNFFHGLDIIFKEK